ncbi:MAG: 4Fe-4S binding protein [Candidatus Omnitrophota bacterium]
MAFGTRKNTWVLFGAFALMGLFLAGASFFDWGRRPFLRHLWDRPFLMSLKILLIVAAALWILKWVKHKVLPERWLKWVYGILFLPVLLLPIFRCYFKVPYIFCRVCPHKCPWGILRSFAFPAFLFLNLSNKSWCTVLCPFGTFQECQAQVSPKRLKLPSWASLSAYFFLFLAAGLYLLTLVDASWVEFFEGGHYSWMEVTVGVALLILGVAFFIPKFGCRYFCPVGTIDRMVTDLRCVPNKPHKEAV